jgi:hypothetical protein
MRGDLGIVMVGRRAPIERGVSEDDGGDSGVA